MDPAWQNIAGYHHIHRQKKIAFSYSEPGGTLEKIRQPKTLIWQQKKMLLHNAKDNHADQKQ